MSVEMAQGPVITMERTKWGNLTVNSIKTARGHHWQGMIFASAEEATKYLTTNHPDREFVLVPYRSGS